jgi:hypothetical protein
MFTGSLEDMSTIDTTNIRHEGKESNMTVVVLLADYFVI